MTAAVPYQAMIAITANAVTATIVRSAAHIAVCAIPQFAWAAAMSVPHVMNRSAKAVLPNARIAKKSTVRIV